MHSYHSDASLLRMKAFRIGRKPVGVWPNMTPPIRGGVYRKAETSVPADLGSCPVDPIDAESASSETDSIASCDIDDLRSSPARDQDSLASSISSDCNSSDEEAIDHVKPSDRSTAGLRKRRGPSSDHAPASSASSLKHLSPAEYTEWAMKEEKDLDRSQFPAIEPEVQQDIAQKYRELHQKVREGGFYQCPYLDYGKECARYATLFITFLVLLRNEWYLTSAIFLGLFWVSPCLRMPLGEVTDGCSSAAPDYVHGP